MTDPIDELKLAKVRRAFLNREGSIRDLATLFGIGEATLKRYRKSENWDALREGREAIAQRTAAEQSLLGSPALAGADFNEKLVAAINALYGDVLTLPGKSRETSAIALTKLIETYYKLNPPTMQELVWALINTPDFDPHKFARLLQQEIARKNG